jgi:outer membrane protein OmpA-like peptidoglycan-associated protein
VYEAKKSLDIAERAFSEEGDAPETRDLAYVAERKAEIARSRCNTALAVQQQHEATAEVQRIQQQNQMAMTQQLGQTKEQLQMTQQQLESERQARAAAEKNTQEALSKIQGLQTKEDQRGLVLTLSGSVLFASGKSTLLPPAQKSLADVAKALKEEKRTITIVGHTDAVGDEQKNEVLSQKRADAVRTYLTTHGVPAEQIQSEGVGEAQPIADNKTPTGRANNRRVEIILSDTKAKQAPAPEK